MTLFLIIFIIFACAQYYKHSKYKNETMEHNKRSKSNASKQYECACLTINKMGKVYRECVSKLTFKKFMNDEYSMKFNYYNPGFILNTTTPLLYQSSFERMWVVFTAKSCDIPLDDNCLTKLYQQGIWESIPEQFTTALLDEWKQKYPSALDNKSLEKYLKASILLKKYILCGNNENSYEAYNNSIALDYVAEKFNLPSNAEKEAKDIFGYKTLQDVCTEYTIVQSMVEKYKHIPLTMICINPTDRQKEIQSKKLSETENLRKMIRSEAQISKKYSN